MFPTQCEEQIMEQVLEKRHGHNRGRRQVVRHVDSSPIVLAEWSRPVKERSYTQAQVDVLLAKSNSRTSQLETKLDALLRGLKANNIEVEFDNEENGDEDEDEDGDEDWRVCVFSMELCYVLNVTALILVFCDSRMLMIFCWYWWSFVHVVWNFRNCRKLKLKQPRKWAENSKYSRILSKEN